MHKISLKSYSIGFVLSLFLTLSAFILTQVHVTSYHEVIPHGVLLPVILGLAFLQLTVQLIFFLHLLQEQKPRWNFLFFVSTFGLVLLVVIASLWIMQHLNYNMTPADMSSHILQDEGIHY